MTTQLQKSVSAKRRALHRALLRWFRAGQRDLPWRRTRDPYRIWLSEIMLQQTRVEAGIAYYNRFLKALPTVEALARAREDTVLKLWEGLGYYSRARNLHKAAKQIVHECGGVFPQTAAAWSALPGVGRYTAGAIASIAFGEPAALVDGNVKRVLARLFCLEDCVDDAATTETIWQIADALIPRRTGRSKTKTAGRTTPGDWNESLMELGALICIPGTPRCERCPVRRHCDARACNMQTELPVRKAKKPVPHKTVAAALIFHKGKFLIGKRPHAGMLAGLWEFPGGTAPNGTSRPAALRRIIENDTGLTVRVGRTLASVDHAYSHFTMRFHLYTASIAKGKPHTQHYSHIRWISPDDLQNYAMPQADRNALRALRIPLETLANDPAL